jgi:hypothetical protein
MERMMRVANALTLLQRSAENDRTTFKGSAWENNKITEKVN